MKSHPLNAAIETISGVIKNIVMGWVAKVVDQKESTRTHDVTTTEARAERTMSLTDIKIVVEARRDKVVVTAR